MMDNSIDDVLRRHTPRLLALPGVVGVARAAKEGRPCVRVLVRDRTALQALALPAEVDGFAVVVEIGGDLTSR